MMPLCLLPRGLEAGAALVPSHRAKVERDGLLSCRAARLPRLGVANAGFTHHGLTLQLDEPALLSGRSRLARMHSVLVLFQSLQVAYWLPTW